MQYDWLNFVCISKVTYSHSDVYIFQQYVFACPDMLANTELMTMSIWLHIRTCILYVYSAEFVCVCEQITLFFQQYMIKAIIFDPSALMCMLLRTLSTLGHAGFCLFVWIYEDLHFTIEARSFLILQHWCACFSIHFPPLDMLVSATVHANLWRNVSAVCIICVFRMEVLWWAMQLSADARVEQLKNFSEKV